MRQSAFCLCVCSISHQKSPFLAPVLTASRRSWLSWVQRRICHSVFLGIPGKCLRMFSESGICLCLCFRVTFVLVTTLTLDFAYRATSCEVMRSGRSNAISLWKTLSYLLHPIQDIILTSQHLFLSDAFISSLEHRRVGGRAIYPGGDSLFKYVIARGEKRQSFHVWNVKSVWVRNFEKTSKWALNKFCCKWITV